MEDYSIENKNIIQNNIQKLKISMKRLKDTINRSNSYNYKNFKIYPQNYYNIFHNPIKEDYKEENISFKYYNIKESVLNKNIKKFFQEKNSFINLKNYETEKNSFIHNNKTKKRYNNKYLSNNFFPNLNLYKNDFSLIIPSRNRNNIEFETNTAILCNNKKANNTENTPKLTDINLNLINEDNNLLHKIYNNKNKNKKNEGKIIRNKSSNQIKIVNNMKDKEKSINNSKDYYDNCNSKKKLFYTNENSLSNLDIGAINKMNKKNYENYLENQITLFSKINRGLLIRYKNIGNNFKSAYEQNLILKKKINEYKIKENKINNINITLETEYNEYKDKLLKGNDKKIILKNNRILIMKKNEELKESIDKYDEIILQLKNKIQNLIEEDKKHNNIEKINDIYFDKVDKYIKEANKQKNGKKIFKKEQSLKSNIDRIKRLNENSKINYIKKQF